jgi:hypothetical protein
MGLTLTWIDDRAFVVDAPDQAPGGDLIIVHLQHTPGDARPWSDAEREDFARRVLDAYRSVRVPAGETLAEAVDKILAQEDLSELPSPGGITPRPSG